jgi:hypothetical protein
MQNEFTVSDDLKIYHRNGVSGVGFYCYMQDNNLCVEFNRWDPEQPEAELLHDPIRVDMALVHELAQHKMQGRRGDTARLRAVKHFDGYSVVAFEYCYGRPYEMTPFIGLLHHVPDVSVPYNPEFAAFRIDMLPDLRFGFNSWRGDPCLNELEESMGRTLQPVPENVDAQPLAAVAYPEHDKLRARRDEHEAVQNFLTWLREECTVPVVDIEEYVFYEEEAYDVGEVQVPMTPAHVFLAVDTHTITASRRGWVDYMKPVFTGDKGFADLIAMYLGIDQKKLEEEKMAMIEEMRRASS